MLALVLAIRNLIGQQWKRVLWWLLLAGLAAGTCGVGVFPLAMAMGGGTTLEVPKED